MKTIEFDGKEYEVIDQSHVVNQQRYGKWTSDFIPEDGDKFLQLRPIKPKPKVIDLSSLVGSDVICEFGDIPPEALRESVWGLLNGINLCTGKFMYKNSNKLSWKHCHPLYNRPQVYTEITRIPVGFEVEWYHYGKDKWFPLYKPGELGYNHVYRITGVSEGWCLPWEARDE